MVLRKIFLIILLAASLWPASAAPAQSGRNRGVDRVDRSGSKDDDVVKLGTTEVMLSVTVRNQFGRLARGLEKDDFIVAENERRQEISSFRVEKVPIHVLLMLDASGSVFERMKDIREAAWSFVEALGPEDQISVVQFADKVQLLQDWTSHRPDIRQALFFKYHAGEYTLLNDAIWFATTTVLPKVTGRKVIILLTDGVDTQSTTSTEAAYDSITRAEAALYVISQAQAEIKAIRERYMGVSGALAGVRGQAQAIIEQFQAAELQMMDRAEKSGGKLFSPVGKEDLAGAYAQVADELKSQYVITYTSSNERKDGGFRSVKVLLTKGGFSAYTRTGYYAPRADTEPAPIPRDPQ